MRDLRPDLRPWLWSSTLLSVCGIVVSGYLAYKRMAGGSLACTRWAECDVVNNSVYSKFFGIPVSFIGLAAYLLLLALALAALWTAGGTQRQILLLSLLLSLGGVGFSVYLTYIEIYVIEALCSWCVASAIIITLLAILGVVNVLRSAPRGA
ncbi:MAG: vitamin K epoxide reductase family protein [candidate division NC10 bacterium]|nr:vitamin K epoxide reductase family protein [candidate division NC10 bacterium]